MDARDELLLLRDRSRTTLDFLRAMIMRAKEGESITPEEIRSAYDLLTNGVSRYERPEWYDPDPDQAAIFRPCPWSGVAFRDVPGYRDGYGCPSCNGLRGHLANPPNSAELACGRNLI